MEEQRVTSIEIAPGRRLPHPRAVRVPVNAEDVRDAVVLTTGSISLTVVSSGAGDAVVYLLPDDSSAPLDDATFVRSVNHGAVGSVHVFVAPANEHTLSDVEAANDQS